nr:MAG TPA: hypothetical protein [Bacteriophage sp.]
MVLSPLRKREIFYLQIVEGSQIFYILHLYLYIFII